jgi:hypothetical protein
MDKHGVCNPEDFDLNSVMVTNVTETQFKSRMVKLLYVDPKALDGAIRIRYDKMRSCFDITPFTDPKDPTRKTYSLNLAFTHLGENDPENGKTLTFCKKYDAYVKELAKTNCMVCFGRYLLYLMF